MAFTIRNNKLPQLPMAARAAAQAAVNVAAAGLQRNIQQKISTRTMRRTGRLQRSVRIRREGGRVQVVVGRGAPYWRYLDRGTQHIRPRRFVHDAIRELGPNQVRNVGNVMREAFQRAL